MRTFSQSSMQKKSLSEKRLRRRSSVVHEEADFAVKVHCWQRKINDEMGTDHEVNLNRTRRVMEATDVNGHAQDDGAVVLRRKRMDSTALERPVSCCLPVVNFEVVMAGGPLG